MFGRYMFLTPGMKMKIPKPCCSSTRHTQSYPRVSFVFSGKCRWSSSDNPYMTKTSFFGHHITQRAKCKFQILTAHLQDIPIHVLQYQLSTLENVDVVQVTNFTEKRNVVFRPSSAPRDKMKLTLLHIFKTFPITS